MLNLQDIQRFGGKAAILNYIHEKLPNMPIPPYTVKEYGQKVEAVTRDFNSMRKPVIVRSSSPYEYGDFEGIFESVKDVYDTKSLESAVAIVERSATSERAKKYSRQNGFEINEVMNIIIQEQNDSQYTGAMMRHPNNPNLIFIHYYSGEGFGRVHDSFLFNEATGSYAGNRVFQSSIDGGAAKFLVDNYKQIESLNGIAEGQTLCVEFGFEPKRFALYQARPFKEIQTVNFDVPKRNHEQVISTDLCFGITAPEGLVLPSVRSIGTTEVMRDLMNFAEFRYPISFEGRYDFEFAHSLSNVAHGMVLLGHDYSEYLPNALRIFNSYLDKSSEMPYCFMISSAHREAYDVDLSVPRMKALVVGEAHNFLVHGLMRLIKKADVSVMIPRLFSHDLYGSIRSLEDKVRIISNGKEAVVFKES